MSKKVAVVGAGLSGLAAAWMLRDAGFDVTVFEANACAGGQVELFELEVNGRVIQFDAYFGNMENSHNLLKMSELLGLSVTKNPFGLCVDYPEKTWANYQSSPFLEQHRNEYLRFRALLHDLYENDAAIEATAVSLQDFLDNNGFSEAFTKYVLSPFWEPMLGINATEFGHLPTSVVVELVCNGTTSPLQVTQVLQFHNGMYGFAQQLSTLLAACIRYNCPVAGIVRHDTGVLLQLADGTEAPFDEVVMACNFENIRRLIHDPTPTETSIFNCFSYKKALVVVHTDTSIVPANFFEDERLDCLVNQHGISAPLRPFPAPQQREPQVLISSTANGEMPAIDRRKILCERTYQEEALNMDVVRAKGLLYHIQGHQHCWYCGLSTTSALMESTVVSGLVVAAQLGARYPFADHPPAARVFDNLRRLMFGGYPSLRIFS